MTNCSSSVHPNMQENYQTHLPLQQPQLVSTTNLESESTQKPKQVTTGRKCIKCGTTLTADNWNASNQRKSVYICKSCCNNKRIKSLNNLPDATYLWQKAKARCNQSGREFTITVQDIEKVDTDVCPLLEIPIKRYPISFGGRGSKYQKPDSKSLDRIDPTKGYTPDNIRVISWRANGMLNNWNLFDLFKCVVNAIRLKYAPVH